MIQQAYPNSARIYDMMETPRTQCKQKKSLQPLVAEQGFAMGLEGGAG